MPKDHLLCGACRNLNIRAATFVDQGWRHPTSLHYGTVQDIVNSVSDTDKERHYAAGEHLEGGNEYSDKELGAKLKSPEFVPEFDEDGMLLNVPPAKFSTLGEVREIKSRSETCVFCRFMDKGAQRFCNGDSGRTYDNDLVKIGFTYNGQGSGYLTRGLMSLDPALLYGNYTCSISIGKSSLDIYPLFSSPELQYCSSRLYNPQVDFTLFKHWLRACESQHERCGPQPWHSSIKPISSLRFIDVQEMCLVDRPPSTRFLALSYVWGMVPMFKALKSNKHLLYLENGLAPFMEKIPTTIRDAMEVTRSIGERYLWTDAICIIQDDLEDKKKLIGSMDVVYAYALLTIVGAGGANANSGLPGVRPDSRPVPDTVEIGELKLVAAKDLGDFLLHCPWSKRGWTYQEGLLSTRVLIFTNDAVHFACNSTTWSEDMHNPSEDGPPPWKYAQGSIYEFRSTLTDRELEGDEGADTVFDLWTTVAGELSERNLSYESDILFAAAGMFGLLEEILGIRSLYGLPETRIEEFLFWSAMHPGQLRQRPGFPSWSWCGWVGEVSWMAGWTDNVESETARDISWEKMDNERKSILPLGASDSGDYPYLKVTSQVCQGIISKSLEPPDWVTELMPYAWSYVPAGDEREGVYCIVMDGVVTGTVVLDTLSGVEFDQLAYDFVVVSSTAQSMDVGDFAGQNFYNVLALRHSDDKWERIGHGRVLEKGIDNKNWEWKTVVLR